VSDGHRIDVGVSIGSWHQYRRIDFEIATVIKESPRLVINPRSLTNYLQLRAWLPAHRKEVPSIS
jgi:hypothetical protein